MKKNLTLSCTLVLLVIAFIGGMILLVKQTPREPLAFVESPNKDYYIEIFARRGIGLLNAPTYITINGGNFSSISGHLECFFNLKTQIDNDDANVSLKTNIWIFWTDETKVDIVLLGMEQEPEIIRVVFDGNHATASHEYSLEKAQEVLAKNGVDIKTINKIYW